METTGYATLTRQAGLMREMQVVANNIANAATTGFRQEGVIFSEYVQPVRGGPSLSMAVARARQTSLVQGTLTRTGNDFDFAIEGEGFFLIETPQGERLTRSGSFSPSAEGDLVTNDGFRVLDAGGAPIFVPPRGQIRAAADGTLSADGHPIAQIGIVLPTDPMALRREDGVMFDAVGGFEPVDGARVVQGFLEGSNVDPIGQVARMITVQRAYEMGQSFLEAEHDRMRGAIKAMMS